MRVLLLNCVSDYPELNLIVGLKNAGLDIVTVQDPRDPGIESLRAAGVTVHKKRIKNRVDLEFDSFLREQIGSFKPDIINATTSRGLASTVRVTKKEPNIRIMGYRGTLGNLSRFSIPSRMAHLNRRVDGIFCNCKAVKQFMLTLGLPDNKLHVVYKGHEPGWYQSNQKLSREQFDIAKNAFLVGCFANIRPLKGCLHLVKAVEKLSIDRPVICLLVGEDRDKQVRKYVQKHGLQDRVRFLGFRKDVSAIIPICDVSVMASIRREGFPRAIIESYCNSIPAICTTVGGMPEMVDHQKTGLLVKPGSVEELTEALTTVAHNPQDFKAAGKAGFEKVKNQFSTAEYIENTIAAYKKTLKL